MLMVTTDPLTMFSGRETGYMEPEDPDHGAYAAPIASWRVRGLP